MDREGPANVAPGCDDLGSCIAWVLKPLTPFLFRFPATQVDMVLGDEGLFLAEYGIPGKVIHTPGHTAGSVSVLLETGDAFVGCMAHSGLPFRLSPGLPVFAEDLEQLRQSWQLLLSHGARTIYPAHGEPFSADVIRKALV
jgi:hydroxyacylglutathione hydrolase